MLLRRVGITIYTAYSLRRSRPPGSGNMAVRAASSTMDDPISHAFAMA